MIGCSDSSAARDLILFVACVAVGATTAYGQTPSAATIGPPIASGESRPVDPFAAQAAPIPTPFVPYASQVVEREAIELGADRAASLRATSLAQPPAPTAIDPGNLVPVNLSSPPAAVSMSPPIAAEPPAPPPVAAESMTPIRPAVKTRAVPTSGGQSKLSDESSAAGSSRAPQPSVPEAASPPIRFSFPQPIIPLETMLRRWLGMTPTRR